MRLTPSPLAPAFRQAPILNPQQRQVAQLPAQVRAQGRRVPVAILGIGSQAFVDDIRESYADPGVMLSQRLKKR